MKRSTLQIHHNVKCLTQMLLWSFCVIEASALLRGQQNDQSESPDFLPLSVLPINGISCKPLLFTEEDSTSSEEDSRAQVEENDFPTLTSQKIQIEAINLPDYSNDQPNHAEVAISEKFHQFSNDPYKMFGVRSRRKRAEHTRVFYLLGIFSRSINQAKWRRQHQQREQEKAKFRARQSTSNKASLPSDALQVLAYADGTSGLMQQDQVGVNQTSDDNKRTIFVSRGWAPSGGIEKNPPNQKSKANEKGIANANMYAFTSNHWGPLGKRGHPTSKKRQRRQQILRLFQSMF